MKQYLDLLKDIKENGVKKEDRTGTGTISVFGRQIKFDLNEGFPLLTTKKIHTKSVLYELFWFLKGDTNIKYLNDNGVTIWDEWANDNGDLGKIYGYQWTNWDRTKYINNVRVTDNINQIDNLINDLINNPDSRRLMVSAWNTGQLHEMNLPPCHYGFQCYSEIMSEEERWSRFIKNNKYTNNDNKPIIDILDENNFPKRKLSLMWNQRSIDTFLGLPFNIASYAFLTHMLAQITNHEVGELIGNLGDTHLYLNHLEYVNKQLQRNPIELPILKINSNIKSIYDFKFDDFEILNYHPQSNWKNVPIAV